MMGDGSNDQRHLWIQELMLIKLFSLSIISVFTYSYIYFYIKGANEIQNYHFVYCDEHDFNFYFLSFSDRFINCTSCFFFY